MRVIAVLHTLLNKVQYSTLCYRIYQVGGSKP